MYAEINIRKRLHDANKEPFKPKCWMQLCMNSEGERKSQWFYEFSAASYYGCVLGKHICNSCMHIFMPFSDDCKTN